MKIGKTLLKIIKLIKVITILICISFGVWHLINISMKIIEYKELEEKIIDIRSKEAKELEGKMSRVVERFYLCGGSKSTFEKIISRCNREDMKLHNKRYSKNTPAVYGNRINFLKKEILLSKDDVEIEVMEDFIEDYEWIISEAKENNLKNDEIEEQERIEAEKQAWEDGREERIEQELIALKEEIRALKEQGAK